MADCIKRSYASIVRFIKGGFWLPFVLPFFIYQLIFKWHLCAAARTKLQDKVVLITGASSGLGEALAHAFYSAGCKVILAARRTQELERVRGALLASTPVKQSNQPVILTLDLSDLKGIEAKAREAVAIHGTVDILVNNSGISSRTEIVSTSLDVDLKLMLVNYFGHVAITKALLRPMIERRSGHIVAISSVQGRIAIPYRSSYAASKHALHAFFDTLRAEVHDKDVKVTVVTAGYIRTNLSLNALTGTGTKHGIMDATTASGISPELAAARIVDSIVRNDSELVLAPITSKIAIILRAVLPRLYFYLMEKRAKKQT